MLRDEHVRTLWVSRIDYQKNSGVGLHAHEDFYQIILIMDGEGTIDIGEDSHAIEPNEFYFIPKGTKHRFIFSSNTTTLDFKFEIIHADLEKLIHDLSINEAVNMEHLIIKLKDVFQLTAQNLHHPHSIFLYRIDVELKGMLLLLLEKYSAHKPFGSPAGQAIPDELHPDFPIIKYLREHMHEKITLESIAREFNFHPHYLIELFRKRIGITPMQLLQRIRIEKAKEYLEFTNDTVTEVSEKVGLSAPYFSRLFREREGVSPSEYREKAVNVIGRDMILEDDFEIEYQPSVEQTE